MAPARRPSQSSLAASQSSTAASSAAAASQKVYLFCLCDCLDNHKLLEDVYVFDIDTNPMLLNGPVVAPAIRFDCGYPMGFCILNSRLYLFDGFDKKCNPNGKSVHFYDFPSSSSSSSSCSGGKPELLLMEKLEQCPSMIGQKLFPTAMPTPDRTKILVFSARIMPTTRTKGYVDFEIYDFLNGTSEELPPVPDHLVSRPFFDITRYYFINDTTFILHTDTSVHLTLSLDRNQKQWEVIVNDNTPVFGAEVVQLIGGDLGVSKFGVYDMIRKAKCRNIPDNPNVDEFSSRISKVMTLVDADPNQLPKICILYADFDWEHRRTPFCPRVYIDVHQIDRAATISRARKVTGGRRGSVRGSGGGRHGENVCTESTVNIIKSWSYEFELSIPYKMFEPTALYPDRVILK